MIGGGLIKHCFLFLFLLCQRLFFSRYCRQAHNQEIFNASDEMTNNVFTCSVYMLDLLAYGRRYNRK